MLCSTFARPAHAKSVGVSRACHGPALHGLLCGRFVTAVLAPTTATELGDFERVRLLLPVPLH